MGFLKLLHRGQPNSDSATAGKNREKAKSGSSTNGNAGNVASSARLGAVRDAPPVLDWELRKRPSTQLISIDDLIDAAPWVDVAREADASQASGSLGFSAIFSNANGSPGQTSERQVNPRLVAILNEANLSVLQCSVLVEACSKVIKEQGLETLGLFRPWRMSESPYAIARALGIFLHIADPDGPAIPLDGIDAIELKQRPAEGERLAVIHAVMSDLEIHDVVACLKWGIRHLKLDASSFGDNAQDPWTWYRSFALEEKTQNNPTTAFSSILLTKISKEYPTLLETILSMMASVAAHAAQNAMTARHLCGLLGFWLFGRQYATFDTVNAVVRDYETATVALEHIFLAYLRTQEKLPSRRLELIANYPPNHAEGHRGDTWLCQHVIISLEKTFKFGRTSWNQKRPAPPAPLAVLANLQAASQLVDSADSSELLVWAHQDSNAPKDAIAEETARVFRLAAERRAANAKNKKVTLPGSQNGLAASAPPSSPANRRRSASLNGEMVGRSSPTGSVGDRAATDLALPRVQEEQAAAARLSWGDFSNNGFSEGMDSDLFSLLTDFSAARTAEGHIGADKPNKLKKPYPFRYRFGGDGMGSPTFCEEEIETLHAEQTAADPSKLRLVKVTTMAIDPAFAELYLDALHEPVIMASWPTFVVAELRMALPSGHRGVLVEQQTHEPNQPKTTSAALSASTATTPAALSAERPPSMATTNTEDGAKKKGLFGSIRSKNKRRMTEMFGRVGNSASMTSLALVRKGSRNSAVISESDAQEVVAEVDEMGRLPASSSAAGSKKGKKAKTVPRTSTEAPRQRVSTSSAGLSVQVSAPSEDVPDLPQPVERPPLPIIIKTSPMSPPRYFPPSPPKGSAEAPESDSSPDTRASSPQRKVSRKPVPTGEGSEADVFPEIECAELEANPTDQTLVESAPISLAASQDAEVKKDIPAKAGTQESSEVLTSEKASATIASSDEADNAQAGEVEAEGTGSTLSKLRSEIAARAAKTQAYFSASPELPQAEAGDTVLVANGATDVPRAVREPATAVANLPHDDAEPTESQAPQAAQAIDVSTPESTELASASPYEAASNNASLSDDKEASSAQIEAPPAQVETAAETLPTTTNEQPRGNLDTTLQHESAPAAAASDSRQVEQESVHPAAAVDAADTSVATHDTTEEIVDSSAFVPESVVPEVSAMEGDRTALESARAHDADATETETGSARAAPSAIFVPEVPEVPAPGSLASEAEPAKATATDVAPSEPAILDALISHNIDNDNDKHSAVFVPQAPESSSEDQDEGTAYIETLPHVVEENLTAGDQASGQPVDSTTVTGSVENHHEPLERVQSQFSTREQLDEDIRRAAGARRRSSVASQKLPISPAFARASVPEESPSDLVDIPKRAPSIASIETGRPVSSTATPVLAIGTQRRKESLSQHSQASPSPTADKRRFGDTFNRVSPSLKARLAMPFNKSSERLPSVSSKKSESDLRSPSEADRAPLPVPGSPEMQADSPTRTKKGSAPASPASPSKAGKMLAGAKKILGRKKSSLKGSVKDTLAEHADGPPPLPEMMVWDTPAQAVEPPAHGIGTEASAQSGNNGEEASSQPSVEDTSVRSAVGTTAAVPEPAASASEQPTALAAVAPETDDRTDTSDHRPGKRVVMDVRAAPQERLLTPDQNREDLLVVDGPLVVPAQIEAGPAAAEGPLLPLFKESVSEPAAKVAADSSPPPTSATVVVDLPPSAEIAPSSFSAESAFTPPPSAAVAESAVPSASAAAGVSAPTGLLPPTAAEIVSEPIAEDASSSPSSAAPSTPTAAQSPADATVSVEAEAHEHDHEASPLADLREANAALPPGEAVNLKVSAREAMAQLSHERHASVPVFPSETVHIDLSTELKSGSRSEVALHPAAETQPGREQHVLPGGMLPIEIPLSEASTTFAETPAPALATSHPQPEPGAASGTEPA